MARNIWQQASAPRPAADHAEDIDAIHGGFGEGAGAAVRGAEEGGLLRVYDTGGMPVGIEIGFEAVMRRHLVDLAALFMQAHSPALAHGVVVLDPHGYRGADAGERDRHWNGGNRNSVAHLDHDTINNPSRNQGKHVERGCVSPQSLWKRAMHTILVVEDELVIRRVAVELLEDAGYNVVEFDNAADAMAFCRDQRNALAAVFTDINMPGDLDGLDVVQLVTAIRPHAAVVVTSGRYDAKPADLSSYVQFLPKPGLHLPCSKRSTAQLRHKAVRQDRVRSLWQYERSTRH